MRQADGTGNIDVRMLELDIRKLARRRTDRVIAGVAGGVADWLGVPAAYARAAFLTLAAVWGLGGIAYLAVWTMTLDRVEDRPARSISPSQGVGLALAFTGLMVLLGVLDWWPGGPAVVTVGALSFGTAALTESSRPGPLAGLMDPGVARPSRVRMLLGVGLLIGGLAVFASSVGPVFEFGAVFVAVGLTGIGLAVAFGPWVRRMASELAEERNERIRQEERAEVAAHLHDSVLQTLALIQRSDDPSRMAILARHQEAELRDWLYGAAPLDGADLMSSALRQAAARVEADHGLPVEVIAVGDRPLDEAGRAVVSAASEAMVNGAKHSGADRLSLFLEVEDEETTVYVTDQGKGFVPDEVPSDRQGISGSIRSRVERVGGTAQILTHPGEGTEVVLRLPGSGN